MTATVTLAELQSQMPPKAHEAVAIVLTLISGQVSFETAAKSDMGLPALPSPSTITLTRDGSVSCSHRIAALSPVEVATLLQQLLEDTACVPPALLYSIARALGMVEAAPFESLDALFHSLARFERGARREVIAGLVTRFEEAGASAGARVQRVERRGMHQQVTYLRHELRAVDRRAYDEHEAVKAAATAPPPTAPGALRRFRPAAIAAGLAAGLACFALGDAVGTPAAPVQRVASGVSSGSSSSVSLASATPASVTLPSPAPVSATVAVATPQNLAVATHRAAAPSKSLARRASRPAPPSRWRSALRFQWVRRLITLRKDL